LNFKKKKSLGQHFLKDDRVIDKMIEALEFSESNNPVIEVGPGEGKLTRALLELEGIDLWLVEKDDRLPAVLRRKFPQLSKKIIHQDILGLKIDLLFKEQISLVGNYPYNISSQIVFLVIEQRHSIPFMMGMFQREVARRLASSSGSKDYGVLSVLTQVYYDVEYLFDVEPECFDPPPRVWSGVIKMNRKEKEPDMDPVFFKRLVKTAFQQRRKKMSNAIKSMLPMMKDVPSKFLDKRPDNLTVEDYLEISACKS